MQIAYTKMHGTGNQILIVDARGKDYALPQRDDLRRLGSAETGPGFDQLMWVSSANEPGYEASYRVFNADGSEVEQCGNGVRCVARFLADRSTVGTSFTLQSPAGPIAVKLQDPGLISVCMGQPEFEPQAIPFTAGDRQPQYVIESRGTSYQVAAVSMGNPHCVIDVDNVALAPIKTLGPELEAHVAFPAKANVGFVEFVDRDRIRLRVFERGVGETAACGTGACAAVVTGQQRNKLDADVHVELPGGQVMVSWRGGDNPVWLTGNAEYLSDGKMDIPL